MFDQENIEEKRRFPRVLLDKGVNYSVEGSNEVNNGISRDISNGGLRLLLFKFVPKDKKITMELQLNEDFIKTSGIVVWNRELSFSGRYEIGIKFSVKESGISGLNEDFETKKTINEYMKNRISCLN
jgi:c-di-GMP-binding flagellar brake protein YcgR